MTQNLTKKDVAIGRFVELLIEATEVGPCGDFIYPGHPGIIHYDELSHVMVKWVGYEDDYISDAMGFDSGEDGIYPSLGILTEAEYESRRKAWISEHPERLEK